MDGVSSEVGVKNLGGGERRKERVVWESKPNGAVDRMISFYLSG